MKKATIFLSLGMIFMSCSSVYHTSESSKECEVLLPTIADDYEGYCKKGKAHGQGTAAGLHGYEGDFVGGFPEGHGTYIWHDERVYTGSWIQGKQSGFGTLDYVENGQSITLSGFWVDGEFAVASDDDEPYSVESKRGVVSPTLRKQGDPLGNSIQILIQRNGENVLNVISDVSIINSSGSLGPINSNYGSSIQIDRASFPLDLSISYRIPNLMNTTIIDNGLQLRINEPGSWTIVLNNN